MDRVLLYDNERLDIVDADRIQAFVDDYVIAALGAVMGVKALDSGGALSGIEFTWNSPNLTLGECVLFTGVPSGTGGRLAEGRVLRHRPGVYGQASSVDLSAYIAGSLETWIWARRITNKTNQETRREHDELTGSEKNISPTPLTVERDIIQWGHGGTKPDGNAGWFKVARVTGWSGGGSPSVRIVHAFDLHDTGQKAAQDTVDLLSSTAVFNQVYGVRNALNDIVRTLALLQDTEKTEAKSWQATPARGFHQLDRDLTVVEDKAAELDAYWDTHNHRQIMVGRVQWANLVDSSISEQLAYDKSTLTVSNFATASAVGIVTLTVPGTVFAVDVQIRKNKDTSDPPAGAYTSEVEISEPSGGNTEVTVRTYKDGAAYNRDFFFMAYGRLP